MNYYSFYIIALLLIFSSACKRIVEIEDTLPVEINYCQVEPALQGLWITDSVHIITNIDTIDSLVADYNPTLFYEIDITCDEIKSFIVSYTNFAGVRTEDVNSSNFISENDVIYALSPFDQEADTNTAGFRMRYVILNDTQVNFSWLQKPNPHQLTRYLLFATKQ